MPLLDTAGRLATTLVSILQTRLELAAVEMEEETLRLGGYLLLSLLALFFVGIAILMFALFVIIVFWDHYRIQAVLGMAGLFGALGAYLVLKVQNALKTKPRLLGQTIAELNKDIAFVKASGARHEQ